MSSIRRFLILLLSATFALIIFVGAVQAFHSGSRRLQDLLDRQLTTQAALLVPQFSGQPGAPMADPPADLAFQLVGLDGRVRVRTANMPLTPAVPLQAGFTAASFSGQRWRVLCQPVATRGWVLVAEPLRVRDRVTDRMILDMLLPTLFGIPVAALIIWLVVGRGLQPLLRLSGRLTHRPAERLEPIQLPELPRELAPVLAAVNDWQARLKLAFERERHFASDAAHELRTPVSALKIHLHNLAEHPGERAAWQAVQAAVSALEHLIEQMLMLYRTAPDQYLARHETVPLDSVARARIAAAYPAIDARQQSVSLEAPEIRVLGNRFALDALFDNLLSNASKYAPAGSEIRVGLAVSGDRAVLCVEDSGPGIAAADRERVLARFQRIAPDSHQQPGCGLGLAIVAHVIAQHGGILTLDDSPDLGGLRVQATLPLAPDTPVS